MAMKKKPGRSKVEVGIPSTEAVFSAGNNNASGSPTANLATQNRAELAYELREIALQDIELNPDNAIFRQLDTDEDVETLANDIDRNGLDAQSGRISADGWQTDEVRPALRRAPL